MLLLNQNKHTLFLKLFILSILIANSTSYGNPENDFPYGPELIDVIDLSPRITYKGEIISRDNWEAFKKKAAQDIRNEKYDEIENQIDQWNKEGIFWYEGSLALPTLLMVIGDKFEGEPHYIEKWHEATGSTYAKSTLADLYVSLAWNSRGNGWSNQVSQEGWIGFEGYLRKAEKLMQDALELNPKNLHAHARVFNVYLGLGYPFEKRLEAMNNAIKVNPELTNVYGSMAYHLTPRWGGSKEALSKFLTEELPKQPTNTGFYEAIYLGFKYGETTRGYLKQDDVRAAMHKLFDAWEEAWPDALSPVNYRIRQLTLNWQPERAHAVIDKALEKYPDWHFGLYRKAVIFEGQQNFEAGLPFAEKAHEVDSYHKKTRIVLAEHYYQLKMYEKAITIYNNLYKTFLPGSFGEYEFTSDRIGLCYSKLGEFEKAIEFYTECLNEYPDMIEHLFNRGKAYLETNQTDKAISDFSSMIELDPSGKKRVLKAFPDYEKAKNNILPNFS